MNGPGEYTDDQVRALEASQGQVTRPDLPAPDLGPTQTSMAAQPEKPAAAVPPAGPARKNPWRYLPAVVTLALVLMAAGAWVGVSFYAPVQHTVSDIFRNSPASKIAVAAAIVPARGRPPFASTVVRPPAMVTMTVTATAPPARTTATATTTAPGVRTTATATDTAPGTRATVTAPPVTTTATAPGATTTVTAPAVTTTVTVPGPTVTVTETVTAPPVTVPVSAPPPASG